MTKGKNGPELSIIVPVYNVEEYLLPCLESIDNSVENIDAEVLLIDDGSTDSSTEIAKDYADTHEKFCYYLKENGGLSDARNYGAERASGRYICFADSDDIIRSNMYENMLAAARYHDADLTIVNVARFDSTKTWGSSLHHRVFDHLEGATVHISSCDCLIYDTTAWNKLIKKEFWDRHGFQYPVGWRFEDMPVSLRMHCKANKVAYVDEVGYMWRVRDGRTASITQENSNVVNLTHRLTMLEDMFDYIDKEENGDKRLKDLLEKKIINLDLPLYVDMIPGFKDEELKKDYTKIINEFYNKYLKAQDMSQFSALIGKKIECALEGDNGRLAELVASQKTDYWNYPVVKTDAGSYLKLPEKLFGYGQKEVEPELTFIIPTHCLTACEPACESIWFSFYCYNKRISIETPEDFDARAFLVNSITGEELALKTVREENAAPRIYDGTVYEIRSGKEHHYEYNGGGFRFAFDLSDMEAPERFTGDNYIVIRYESKEKSGRFLFNSRDEVVRKIYENLELAAKGFRAGIRADANDNMIIRITEQGKAETETGKPAGSEEKEFIAGSISVDGPRASIAFDPPGISCDDARLAYYDPLAEKTVILGRGDNGVFTVDFSDPLIEDDLYTGEHELMVIVTDGGEEEEYPAVIEAEKGSMLFTGELAIAFFANARGRLSIAAGVRYPLIKNKRVHFRDNIYPEMRKNLPVDEKCILFEAYWGDQYSCNPRALYEYIDKHHPEYKCVWSFTDRRIPINGRGIRVEKYSEDYYRYLATTKYLVNNVNFENAYKKRDGQIEIQTMHGTPYKTLGLDVESDFRTEASKHKYIVRNRRWNYLIVQGRFSEKMAWQWFRYKGKVLRTGYPRTDQLFNVSDDEKLSIRNKYGIPLDKKIILYAPTFRQAGRYEMPLDLEYARKKLADDYVLLIRLHHFAAKSYRVPEDNKFIFDAGKYSRIDDLYKIADVVITDYSSVMFDFALTGKPMVFFTYDLEEYTNNLRGSYFSIEEEAPGPIVRTTEELVDAILAPGEGDQERRRKFFEEYLTYEQPESCRAIVDEVLLKKQNDISAKKMMKKLLKGILPEKTFNKIRKKIIRRSI